jgi:hypothetical protein
MVTAFSARHTFLYENLDLFHDELRFAFNISFVLTRGLFAAFDLIELLGCQRDGIGTHLLFILKEELAADTNDCTVKSRSIFSSIKVPSAGAVRAGSISSIV